MRIADLLSHGPENGTTMRDLGEMADLPGREVRRMIERERRSGTLILSNQHGYYMADSSADVQRFVRSMRHRAWEMHGQSRGRRGLTDVFWECRKRVSAEDAARRYGLTFDRRGWAVCPFHQDKHPSMSFRAGRFRCWACNASGDAVDLTGRLLGLEPMAALERLNADFALALPLHRKPTPEEAQAARHRMEIVRAHKEFEKWRKAFISKLCAAYRVAHIALRDMTDWESLTEREALAVRWQLCFEH